LVYLVVQQDETPAHTDERLRWRFSVIRSVFRCDISGTWSRCYWIIYVIFRSMSMNSSVADPEGSGSRCGTCSRRVNKNIGRRGGRHHHRFSFVWLYGVTQKERLSVKFRFERARSGCHDLQEIVKFDFLMNLFLK
jgi:hypothetical protein